MDKAEALISALRLLFTTHEDHIWVYAMRETLKPTPMNIYERATVEQLVRDHSQVMLAITQLNTLYHKATPLPDGYYRFRQPSTTS